MFVALYVTPACSGTDIGGIPYDDAVAADRSKLRLMGAGLLKYMGIFDVYAAAFYAESRVPVEEAPGDTGIRSEVCRLRPRTEHHKSLYESVRPGGRYSIAYLPGRGTERARNKKPVGVIEGVDFAAALLLIRVGDSPIDLRLRQPVWGVR